MSGGTRIAIFLATSGHSGVDRAAKNLIPELAARGYRVDLLHVREHGPILTEIPHGVRVIDLGHAHVYSCIAAVARYLRREQPAVLYADKDRVNRTALIARWLARAQTTRVLLCVGTPVSLELAHRPRWKRWLHRFSMRHLYPYADRIIADSVGVMEDVIAFAGLDRERVRVVPRPVVPQALFVDAQPRPEHPWFDEGQLPVVLGVGELSPGKDFFTLIRAFARLRAQRPCRLVLVGKGGQRDALRALARQLGVGDDVDFTGFRRDVYRFMAHAAVLALTSRREGLSFVLIEALACGTQVASTDCPHGPRAVLQYGRHGPLVPVGDDVAMAEALQCCLDEPLPPLQLRTAARRYEIEAATDAVLAAMDLLRYADAAHAPHRTDDGDWAAAA